MRPNQEKSTLRNRKWAEENNHGLSLDLDHAQKIQ
jgi:hypothetical protein